MNCLVCEATIVPVDHHRDDIVHDAVVIKIEGNYGSGVYDPPRTERVTNHLRAYLCDTCLETKAARGLITMVQVNMLPQVRTATWTPGKQFTNPAPQ